MKAKSNSIRALMLEHRPIETMNKRMKNHKKHPSWNLTNSKMKMKILKMKTIMKMMMISLSLVGRLWRKSSLI